MGIFAVTRRIIPIRDYEMDKYKGRKKVNYVVTGNVVKWGGYVPQKFWMYR